MASHIVLFVLSMIVLSTTAYAGKLNVPGTPLINYTKALSLVEVEGPEEGSSKCNSVGFRCEDTCNSPNLQYCEEEGKEPTVNKACEKDRVCAMSSGSPACVERESILCKEFECPGRNRAYPDLYDCNRYYYCNNEGEPIGMVCPKNFVYDPEHQNCGPQSSVGCRTLRCPDEGHKLLPYPGDKSLFAVCMTGQLTLRECPDPQEFSRATCKCELNCKSQGKFPFRNDCRKFYHCERRDAKPVPDTCAVGAIFNNSTKSCEAGECAKGTY